MKNSTFFKSDIDHSIIHALKTTSLFVKSHPSIVFTKADKSNATVAINRNDYIYKMNELLSGTDTYSLIKVNPINKILCSLKELLKKWKSNSFISDQLLLSKYFSIYSSTSLWSPEDPQDWPSLENYHFFGQ